MISAAMSGVAFTLQDAKTTGNGNVIVIPSSITKHRLTIKGSTGVSAGTIQPESANASDYSGTWSQIGGGPITVVDDTELEYNWEGNYSFIRSRISTDITDGTVTVTYTGTH